MNRILKSYRNLMSTHNRSLFLLELAFLILFLVFVLPLINLGTQLTIRLWGQSYITFENVLSYLSNPPTLLFLLLMAALISFFLLFQLITMICCCIGEMDEHKQQLPQYLLIGLLKMKRCFNSRNIALPFFAIFLFELMTLPVLICITFKVRISFLGNADLGFIKVLLLLIYALVALIAFRGMFVVYYFIRENKNFAEALELSKGLLLGRSLKTFRILLFNNLILSIICLVIYYFIFLFTALFIFLSVERSMVITVFLSFYPRISITLFVVFQMAAYITNLNIITKLYLNYQELDLTDTFLRETTSPDYIKLNKLQKHKFTLDGLLIFVAVAGLSNAYATVKSDTFYLKNALIGIQVSSHRGNSHVAPENTLPALENAIIAGSDYAEIDVRQTKDGVLVLLHDSNLKRTAGLNRKIETLELRELSQLDAGAWFSSDYIMTRIPSLEEAMILCKGRIKLNIEIKAGQKGPMFEENLVALINEYDFEHQCLISSSDYSTLVKIKQLNENLKTGLILSAAYGDYYDKTAADFFSIRSNHITRQVVKNAHRVGKEVHAWTVNRVSEIERMKSIGVDCIITDNPTLTKRTLFQEDTGMTFLDLLNHLLSDS